MGDDIDIAFYLNGALRRARVSTETTALELLRDRLGVTSVKEGCGEGDCGACTIALGGPEAAGAPPFRAVASCILPATKLHGMQVITSDGLGGQSCLHLIQRMIVDHRGVQCGYCSPGIVMSFFCLFAAKPRPTMAEVEVALQGNICRCTGYEGIRAAGAALVEALAAKGESEAVDFILPPFARDCAGKLAAIPPLKATAEYCAPGSLIELRSRLAERPSARLVAGGTDIYPAAKSAGRPVGGAIDLGRVPELRELSVSEGRLRIGAALSLGELSESPRALGAFPELESIAPRVASTQVRSVATLAGNLANASPIGDFSVFLLASGAALELVGPEGQREVRLADFFLGYRKTALRPGEAIAAILVPLLRREGQAHPLSFAKSAKRRSVDIASVNSASFMRTRGKEILEWRVAFGGVAPVPLLVPDLLGFGRIDLGSPPEAAERLGSAVAAGCGPISDIRGSAEFRRILVRNQVVEHFLAHAGRGSEGGSAC